MQNYEKNCKSVWDGIDYLFGDAEKVPFAQYFLQKSSLFHPKK